MNDKNDLQNYHVNFKSQEILFKENTQGDCAYILVVGELAVIKNGIEIVTIKEEGSFIGEMSLILDEPRSATVISKTHSTCVKITKENFEKVFSKNPIIGFKIARTIALRLSLTTKELASKIEHIKELKYKISEFQSLAKKNIEQSSTAKKDNIHIVTMRKVKESFPFDEKVQVIKTEVNNHIFKLYKKDFKLVQQNIAKFNKDIDFIINDYQMNKLAGAMIEQCLDDIAKRYNVDINYEAVLSERYKTTFCHHYAQVIIKKETKANSAEL